MSTGALILTAGFALLVILGFPFAIAIAAVSALFLVVVDMEPAFLASKSSLARSLSVCWPSPCSCWRVS